MSSPDGFRSTISLLVIQQIAAYKASAVLAYLVAVLLTRTDVEIYEAEQEDDGYDGDGN